MKIFQFLTPDGTVEMKVDLLSTDLNLNATVMEKKYYITNTDMTTGYTNDQAIANFEASYPYFASVQELVTTGAALKKIATDHNLTLHMIDSSSPVNSDGGDTNTTLNSSTTTTSTSTTSTTTTTASPTTTTSTTSTTTTTTT